MLFCFCLFFICGFLYNKKQKRKSNPSSDEAIYRSMKAPVAGNERAAGSILTVATFFVALRICRKTVFKLHLPVAFFIYVFICLFIYLLFFQSKDKVNLFYRKYDCRQKVTNSKCYVIDYSLFYFCHENTP